MNDTQRWPKEIRLAKDKRTLHVAFSSGEVFDYPAEYLRVFSPSAEVQGHSPSQKQTVPGKIDVEIMKIEPVGRYAVRLTFTDLHNSGIYSWDYFWKLATERETLWAQYLDELAQKGLSRERQPRDRK